MNYQFLIQISKSFLEKLLFSKNILLIFIFFAKIFIQIINKWIFYLINAMFNFINFRKLISYIFNTKNG